MSSASKLCSALLNASSPAANDSVHLCFAHALFGMMVSIAKDEILVQHD